MAGGVARFGDILGRGGILVAPVSPDVTVNGRPVALEGCVYTPHWGCPKDPRHCVGPTFAVPEGVTVNGLPPITKGSIGLCLEPVTTASEDVFIAGTALGQAVSLGVTAFNLASSFGSAPDAPAAGPTDSYTVFDDGSILQTFEDGSVLSIGTDGSTSSLPATI